MVDPYISAGIAALVSILVSLIGFISIKYQLAGQMEKLMRETEVRRAEKLSDLRLKHYPKFFEITSTLTKPGLAGQEQVDAYRATLDAIRVWRSGEPMLVLSKHAISTIYELEQALKANPEKANTSEFSQAQVSKVWRLRQRSRGALRRDLNLLFGDDNEGDFIGVRNRWRR